MPHVASDASEKDIGVTALEAAHKRHLRNGMALPEIFAQEESINPRGVTANDHIPIIVRKNLGLDEIARAEQIGDRARFAHCAERALPKSFVVVEVGALQFLPGKRGKFFAVAKLKMPRNIDTFESCEGPHADIVKLRQ